MPTKSASAMQLMGHHSAVAYVEAVKLLRLVFLLALGVAFVVGFSCLAIFAIVAGSISLYSFDREALSWFAIVSGLTILLLMLLAGRVLMSESRWIEVFKIDRLVEEIHLV